MLGAKDAIVLKDLLKQVGYYETENLGLRLKVQWLTITLFHCKKGPNIRHAVRPKNWVTSKKKKCLNTSLRSKQ